MQCLVLCYGVERLVGAYTKLGAFATIVAALVVFINSSALTPMLETVAIEGITFEVIFTIILLAAFCIGCVAIWNRRDQPAITRRRAKEIALANLSRGHPDAQNITIQDRLTRLEGMQWHLVGTMLELGSVTSFSVWINCNTGNYDQFTSE